MKVLMVMPLVTMPRMSLERSFELSKHCSVVTILGWVRNDYRSLSSYTTDTHKVIKLNKSSAMRTKWKGVIDEISFVMKAVKYIRKYQSDVVIIERQRFAYLYPLLCPGTNMVAMCYLNTVGRSKTYRKISDCYRRFTMTPFKKMLVPHVHLIDYYRLHGKRTYVIKWGLNPISSTCKVFDKLRLLYIGSISGRKLEDTVIGLNLYLMSHPDCRHIQYHIIGSGQTEVVENLKMLIKNLALEDVVYYHGRLSDEEIKQYFDTCNVGVSYVPIVPYFTDLAVTKTVEYLLSGLAVVATATNYHKTLINNDNGTLITDSPEDFATGLENVVSRLSEYSSKQILYGAKEISMDYLVKHSVLPALNDIAQGNINKC